MAVPIDCFAGNVTTNNVSIYCHPITLQARSDGAHAAPVSRGNPAEEGGVSVPPGVRLNYGNPLAANPFVQLKLPQGMVHENRKSRCVSFVGEDGVSFKGTARSKHNALECVQSWAWSWWGILSDSQKNSVRALANKRAGSDDESNGGASKKQKSQVLP